MGSKKCLRRLGIPFELLLPILAFECCVIDLNVVEENVMHAWKPLNTILYYSKWQLDDIYLVPFLLCTLNHAIRRKLLH